MFRCMPSFEVLVCQTRRMEDRGAAWLDVCQSNCPSRFRVAKSPDRTRREVWVRPS